MNAAPSVVFLIPFAPRKVKSKWETACAQLRQTLYSIQNSSNENYGVVVASNEAPDLNAGFDSRFHFIKLDHTLPAHEKYLVVLRLDKLRKIGAAWEYAKSKWSSRYVMKLDADDFISSKLVDWLDKAGTEAGYLIKYGWLWQSGSHYLIQGTKYLDRVCGSCLIIRSDLADKTGPFLTEMEGIRLDEASSKFAASDHYSLVPGSRISTLLLNNTHQRYAAQFAYLGHKLATLPFPAVVYRTNNSDSLSKLAGQEPARRAWHYYTLRIFIGKLRRMRFISESLRREFMLQ